MEKKYKVGGMACSHCSANVEHALHAVSGVESVSADCSKGIVTIVGEVTTDVVANAIENLGFDFLGEIE